MPRARRQCRSTSGRDVVDPTRAGTSSRDPTGAGPSSSGGTSGDPTGAGPSAQAGFTEGVHDPDTFSPLLWTHHVKHRVSLASIEDDVMLAVRHRRSEIPFIPHKEMERCLLNLGLYQMTCVPQCKIDQSLMHGLAERWRPETHSFHLPFGEMTVTLGDVSALWGLRIDGDPIGGISDSPDLQRMIPELLGCDPTSLQKKLKKKGEEEGDRYSGYCISLSALRSYFCHNQISPETDDIEAVRRYTRGFVLDYFGAVMFEDSSGDAVPIMYLSLLRNMESESRWNWGGAVLAHLYRGLCHACLVKNKQFCGPLLLLQHWSWAHLPVNRPVIPLPHPVWGAPDPDRCVPYSVIWGRDHEYEEKGKGISYVRNQLQMLRAANIDWFPYRAWYKRGWLSRLTLDPEQIRLWYYRGPVVCFWIVEYHYPDRVSRQFGFDAFIPNYPLKGKDDTDKFHKTTHSKTKVDWSQHFILEYDWARHPEQHLWSPPPAASLGAGPRDLRYSVWYQKWGMTSVYLTGHYGEGLRRRLMDSSSNFLPWGPINAYALLTAARGVGHSLILMARDAWRAFGCQMLKHSAPIMEIGGFDGHLVGMLRDSGENINWREIQETPRNPNYEREPVYADEMPPPPTADDDSGWAFHNWVLNTQGWDAYRNKYGVPIELGPDGASRWNADPGFSTDELAPVDTDADVIGSHIPRYGVEMEHDYEAGGSASQPTDGFASAPPPTTFAASWEH